MPEAALQTVYQATVMAKILYVASGTDCLVGILLCDRETENHSLRRSCQEMRTPSFRSTASIFAIVEDADDKQWRY